MDSSTETQHGDTAISEAETHQLAVQTQAQLATIAQVTMPGIQSTTSPTVTLVQLPNGQTVQVQGVIQAAQSSVIQSPHVQTVHISTIPESEDSQESVDSMTDSQKRREILSRRPSYRKILNELSSDTPAVPRIEEEKSEEESAPTVTTMTMPAPIYQTSSGQYTIRTSVVTFSITDSPLKLRTTTNPMQKDIHKINDRSKKVAITQGGAIQLPNNGTDGVQGLQTLTMSNTATSQGGATIVQYTQSPDGQQIFVPSSQVVVQGAAGDVQTYQIRTTPNSTTGPGMVMASSPVLQSQPQNAEETTRKREIRLMKNREAARECRRKKKEYVKCLENRVAVLENQNKTLIEELKALKDLYCHKSD